MQTALRSAETCNLLRLLMVGSTAGGARFLSNEESPIVQATDPTAFARISGLLLSPETALIKYNSLDDYAGAAPSLPSLSAHPRNRPDALFSRRAQAGAACPRTCC